MSDDRANRLSRPFLSGGQNLKPADASRRSNTGHTDAHSPARAYVITGGRTRAREDLGYETLVTTTPGASDDGLNAESVRILELAGKPISAAELSVALRVPINVALILTSDLADAGLVSLHGAPKNSAVDVALLKRLRRGISTL